MKKFVACALTGALITCSSNVNICMAEAAEPANDTTKGNYVIQTENRAEYQKVLEEYGAQISDNIGDTEYLEQQNILNLELTKEQANKINRELENTSVEKDIILTGSGGTDEDTEVEEKEAVAQWNLDMLGVDGLSEEVMDTKDHVKVAVLDTGVCASSEIPLAGRINLVPGEEDIDPLYEDVSGHGTGIASVIVATDDGDGIKGVNPNAEVYSVKALDDGKKAPLSRVVQGIYWCIDNDIDIINMSFGTNVDSEILRKAVQDAADAGILMIAAAGNGAQTGVCYPAAYPEVVAVGSIDNEAESSAFSAVGSELEIVAPGEKIPATGFFDEILETEGTSMSTAQVTGVASILWDQDTTKDADFIRGLLKASANELGEKNVYGAGLVDVSYALEHYAEYENAYKKNATDDIAWENTQEVATYSDAEVEALWSGNAHQTVIEETGYVESKKKLLKYAIKIVDDKDFFKTQIIPGVDSNHFIHGFGNYVADTIFLENCAYAYKNGNRPTTNAQWASLYPADINEYSKEYGNLKQGLTSLEQNWDELYNNYRDVSESNGHDSLFLLGMAIHCAMDSYAHSFVAEESDGEYRDTSSDVTTDIPARYETAKAVARSMLEAWDGDSGVFYISQFYQPATHKVGTSGFYMECFLEYVLSVQPNLASINSTKYNWFNARSFDRLR